MVLKHRYLLLPALLSLMQPSQADEGLSQTTLSIYANGKPVGGLIFPIGGVVQFGAVSNNTEGDDTRVRYTGNVQGRVTPPAEQAIVLFGEDIVLSREAISAERARAVQDLEKMSASDQLYRGRAAGGAKLTFRVSSDIQTRPQHSRFSSCPNVGTEPNAVKLSEKS